MLTISLAIPESFVHTSGMSSLGSDFALAPISSNVVPAVFEGVAAQEACATECAAAVPCSQRRIHDSAMWITPRRGQCLPDGLASPYNVMLPIRRIATVSLGALTITKNEALNNSNTMPALRFLCSISCHLPIVWHLVQMNSRIQENNNNNILIIVCYAFTSLCTADFSLAGWSFPCYFCYQE
jgi:hypothetical protein